MTEHFIQASEVVRARRLPEPETPADFAALTKDERELYDKYSEYVGKQGYIHDIADVRPRPASEVGIDRDRYPRGENA